MSKVTPIPVTSVFNTQAINENNRKFAEALNEGVLWRKNPEGEPNDMKNDIDMNSRRIYNLPEPTLEHEAARFKEVKDLKGKLETVDQQVERAEAAADRAEETANKIGDLDSALEKAEDFAEASQEAASIASQKAADASDSATQAEDSYLKAEAAANVAENLADVRTFLTKSDAESDPGLTGFIRITNDPNPANNGYWIVDSGVFTFSDYQPVDKSAVANKLVKFITDTKDILFSVTDSKNAATDLTVRKEDGQLHDFVVKRLLARFKKLGFNRSLTDTGFARVKGGNFNITEGDVYERNGEVLPILTDMSMFAGWGSSSMQRSETYFTNLATEFNATYYNGGVGGQQTEHIAARLGSIPALCTFPDNEIPSDTSPVTVQVEGVGLHFNQDYLGAIGGVKGRLWNNDGVYSFARTSSGDSVTISPKTPFIPDEGVRNRAALTFLWMGRNDLTADSRVDSCIENTHASFSYMAPLTKRVLVMGHFKGDLTPASPSWARIEKVNKAHKAVLGNLFVDVNEYVLGDDVWTDTGITPTSQDLADKAVGTTPTSLRSDGLHLRPVVYQAIVENLVKDRLLDLGWLTV